MGGPNAADLKGRFCQAGAKPRYMGYERAPPTLKGSFIRRVQGVAPQTSFACMHWRFRANSMNGPFRAR